jgi:hypothetical protein
MEMVLQRGLFRIWIILACLFAGAFAITSSDAINREFKKAGEMERQRASIIRSGVLRVPCQVHGKIPFDFLEKNQCGYYIESFRMQDPQYRKLSDEQLLDRLCYQAGINMKSPFHPWRRVLELAARAVGTPVAVLILGWALLWAFRGFRHGQQET